MTLQGLSRLFLLKAEREKLHRRWAELRAESTGISPPRLDGAPKGLAGRGSRAEQYALLIVGVEKAICDKDAEIIRETAVLYRLIGAVPDSKTRLILALRFVDCLTWDQVARSIGDGCTDWQVKRHCYRYFENAMSTANDAS